MDLMKMMKQAQNLQKRIKEVQEELAAQEITAESQGGAVKVVCTGQGRFKSIKLSAKAINPANPESVDEDTIEMLEDLITTSVKQATAEAVEKMEKKIKSLTGGINIPGLM